MNISQDQGEMLLLLHTYEKMKSELDWVVVHLKLISKLSETLISWYKLSHLTSVPGVAWHMLFGNCKTGATSEAQELLNHLVLTFGKWPLLRRAV
jgi:hypothetical protein